MQGNKELKKANDAIRKAGLNTALYIIVTELENCLIVKHRITGDIKVLEK